MSPLDPLNEIGYMPPPSNLEDQIQLTPTIFGAPVYSSNKLTSSKSCSCSFLFVFSASCTSFTTSMPFNT